jgi:hypothetical protein
MDPQTIAMLKKLGLDSPEALQRIVEGFRRNTKLDPKEESKFQQAVKQLGQRLGRPMNPDDPTYDMRAAYQAGFPGGGGHLESTFKGLGDDRMLLPLGKGGQLLDTRNMKPANQQLIDVWKIVSQVMNSQ